MLTRSAGAARGFDLAGRGDELDQNVEALVVNFFRLEFGYGFSAGATKLGDGAVSFLARLVDRRARCVDLRWKKYGCDRGMSIISGNVANRERV